MEVLAEATACLAAGCDGLMLSILLFKGGALVREIGTDEPGLVRQTAAGPDALLRRYFVPACLAHLAQRDD